MRTRPEDLPRYELGGASGAGAFEKVQRGVERDLRRGSVRKELALDAAERGRNCSLGRRQLHDRARCERGEVGYGSRERRERRAPRFVRDRDGDIGARGQRLDESPLGRRQILEAVREHRRAVPGGEVLLEPLGRASSEPVAVPGSDPVELVAVRLRESPEVAPDPIRVDERRLELAESSEQNVREAARAG